MTTNYDFSRNANQQLLELTPLGAAIVEAMPDRAKMKRIQRAFSNQQVCQVSAIFDADAVEKFYRDRGKTIAAEVSKS